jgi:hypothetical protein
MVLFIARGGAPFGAALFLTGMCRYFSSQRDFGRERMTHEFERGEPAWMTGC